MMIANLAGTARELYNRVCFRAGTPLLTPTGAKLIEQFRVGDLILSRSEFDPVGALEAQRVEEIFVRTGHIMIVRVGGREIRTTREHPFYVQGKGWVAAGELQVGDQLSRHDGQWIAVEELRDTGEYEIVYNLRVADYHTYFVGSEEWGFSVWAHNACVYQVTDDQKIVRYVGIANTRRGITLPSRLRAGINKVREFFGITNVEGSVIPGTQNLTTEQAEQIEQALIRHYGRLDSKLWPGTLLNRSNGTSMTGYGVRDGTELLRKIGYPGF
jgi:hypothetical protein